MKAETRQSITLIGLQLGMCVKQGKFFTCLHICISVNDDRSATSIDFGVKFSE